MPSMPNLSAHGLTIHGDTPSIFATSCDATMMQQFKCYCSSTEAEAEIKDEHWHVEDQPQAPGNCMLMATWHCMCLLLKCTYMQCLMLCFTCQHMLFLLHDIQCKGAHHAASIFCEGASSGESGLPHLPGVDVHAFTQNICRYCAKVPSSLLEALLHGPCNQAKGCAVDDGFSRVSCSDDGFCCKSAPIGKSAV